MQRATWRLVGAWIAGAALAAGCDAYGGGVTVDAYAERWPAALCALEERCCALRGETRSECESRSASGLSPIRASVEAGRIVWDAHAAADCLAAVEAASCGASWRGGLCDGAIVVPNAQPGDACTMDLECVLGWCDGGRCATPPALGERCAEAGMHCGPNGCFPRCEEDLVCDAATGLCRAGGADGDACTEHPECRDGLFCDRAAMACRPRLGEGASCTDPTACREDLTCSFETCQPFPSAAEGEPCSGVRCEEGLFCNESLVCEVPRAAGAPCVDERGCEVDLVCNEGVCSATSC